MSQSSQKIEAMKALVSCEKILSEIRKLAEKGVKIKVTYTNSTASIHLSYLRNSKKSPTSVKSVVKK